MDPNIGKNIRFKTIKIRFKEDKSDFLMNIYIMTLPFPKVRGKKMGKAVIFIIKPNQCLKR